MPPKIIGPTLQQLETSVRNTVEIECKATGIPQPDIIWTFDGKPIFESDTVEVKFHK